MFQSLTMKRRRLARMIKRKLQDLTACCAYQVNFLHEKEHSWREFKRQYEVEEEIGRGGFGVVYGGIRLSDNVTVAIKYIAHRHVREWTLENGHLIPSEVSHLEMCSEIPGVVKIIDWFANSKGFVVIMERPDPCIDVFDLVSRYGRLDEETARGIFLQIIETVCSMFARCGLVHRDIKDENIIINMETGEVKLVDFGATTSCDKATKKEFQGTRSYCPPEWFRLLQYLPLEATSWSLGVLLFILVTGTLPFKNEIQTCLGRVHFPSYLSKECCSLIKRCLTTVPSSRANLLEIRGHSWLAHDVPLYTDKFQDVLDRRLLRHDCSSRRGSASRDVSVEENHLLDSAMSMSSRMPKRESTEYLEAVEYLPPLNGCPSRSSSRYDNLSASSLADYFSLASFDSRMDSSTDWTSVPSTSSSRLKGRSHSAYSLNSRRRRSLLTRNSYERELDTVEEDEHSHSPYHVSQSQPPDALLVRSMPDSTAIRWDVGAEPVGNQLPSGPLSSDRRVSLVTPPSLRVFVASPIH